MKSSLLSAPVVPQETKRRGRPPKNQNKNMSNITTDNAQPSHRPGKRPRHFANHEGIVEQVHFLTGTLYIFKGRNPRVEFIRRV